MLFIDYLVHTLQALPQNFKVTFTFGTTPLYNQEDTNLEYPNEDSCNDNQTLSLYPKLGKIAPIYFENKGNRLVYTQEFGYIDIIDSKSPMTVKEVIDFLQKTKSWSDKEKSYAALHYTNFDDLLSLPKSLIKDFKIEEDMDNCLNVASDSLGASELYTSYDKGDFYIIIEKPNRVIITLKSYSGL